MEVCEIRYAPTQGDITDAQMVELISGNGLRHWVYHTSPITWMWR